MTGTPPSWLRDTPLAHRGLHGPGVPENSLAAFAAAAAAGYGVELDVRLSADGVPVVLHDVELSRATGHKARVADLTARQLAGLHLRGGDGQVVPTLPQALGALAGQVPAMVEIKSVRVAAGDVEPVVAAVLDAYDGPVCIASFNPRTVAWFRRHRPRLPRVLTAGGFTDTPMPAPLRRRLAALRDLSALEPAAVSYQLADLPNAATDRWRAQGGTLITWTVTTPEQLVRARALADNLIFEHVRP